MTGKHLEANQFKDFLNGKTYQVPTIELKSWTVYRFRYILGVLMMLLLVQIGVSEVVAITLGLGYSFISEIRYRTSFLKKCIPVKVMVSEPKTKNPVAFIVNGILYIVLGAVLGVYTYTAEAKNTLTVTYGLYALAIMSLLLGLICWIQYFRSRNS